MDQPKIENAGFWTRLQMLDRRILYVILLLVVGVPTIFPVTVPVTPMKMSEDLWEAVDKCPPNKIIIISSTWNKSTRGENRAQAVAVLNHIMKRHIRFLTTSFEIQASQIIQNTVEELAPKYDYQYGRDWAHLGFQPVANPFVKSLVANLVGSRRDARESKLLSSLPVMHGINSIDDVYMVIEISASASQLPWIQFMKPGVKIGFCCTAVMAPESVPYYQSQQLAGFLWGARGGYDYEYLNVKNHITTHYADGRQFMGPLACALFLVIVAIVVGNIAMFLSRGERKTGGIG